MTKTRKEFIDMYQLKKTNTKCIFTDGMSVKTRTLYVRDSGSLYVFYNNDLFVVNLHKGETLDKEEVRGHLGAGYSWYH